MLFRSVCEKPKSLLHLWQERFKPVKAGPHVPRCDVASKGDFQQSSRFIHFS